MRRIAMLAGTVIGVALGVFVTSVWLLDTEAQGDRTIPVSVTKMRDIGDATKGDPCDFPVSRGVYPGAPSQIVVRDATDTIVGLLDLTGSTWTLTDDGSQLVCEVNANITVPPSPYYTVFMNEDRVRSFQSADFPIEHWSEGIAVVVGI